MPYLITIVIFVGLLCVLDLVLTLGVVRRLREHTKLLDALYEFAGATRSLPGLGVGDIVADFGATTVAGTRVSRDLMPSASVVAFLSPDCQGCNDQLPEIASWASGQDSERVLVVVDGRNGDPAPFVDKLAPVAQVVVDDAVTSVGDAFGVTAYPMFFLLAEGGKLVAVAPQLARLPVGSLA